MCITAVTEGGINSHPGAAAPATHPKPPALPLSSPASVAQFTQVHPTPWQSQSQHVLPHLTSLCTLNMWCAPTLPEYRLVHYSADVKRRCATAADPQRHFCIAASAAAAAVAPGGSFVCTEWQHRQGTTQVTDNGTLRMGRATLQQRRFGPAAAAARVGVCWLLQIYPVHANAGLKVCQRPVAKCGC